jgi:hypothetical protein
MTRFDARRFATRSTVPLSRPPDSAALSLIPRPCHLHSKQRNPSLSPIPAQCRRRPQVQPVTLVSKAHCQQQRT